MFIATQQLLKDYDAYLLENGYTIEALIDCASDCLLPYFEQYNNIALVIGPGNNGADGLSLALKLHAKYKTVHLYCMGQLEHLSYGNRYYYELCLQQDIPIVYVDEKTIESLSLANYEVVGDAMFGFGLDRSPKGLYQQIIEQMNQLDYTDVIAIDIPTGLNCNTGSPYQSVIYATQTISFAAYKQGYLNPDSVVFTGEVHVEDLNVIECREKVGFYTLLKYDNIIKHLKERTFDGYKNSFGKVLMIAGSQKYTGAALLCAKAGLYSGCGMVTVMSHSSLKQAVSLYSPELLFEERPAILQKEDLLSYQSILIGCGIGLDIDAYRYVLDTLTLSEAPLVLDADALTILSSNLNLLLNQNRPIVLTPHIGEFKRLVHCEDEEDLMKKATQFALDYHIILVLKGPYTMITNGEENYRIDCGDKAMAIGGMGDTLAGMITSFLAQPYLPMQAVVLATYLHSYCGLTLAQNQYSVMPSQLIESIPRIMHKMIKEKVSLQ